MDEMNRISDYRTVEVVAFDADDTLWVNEPFFRESERRFCALVAPWAGAREAVERLYAREVANMPLYGYGVKACVLSMVETALELGGERLPAAVVGSYSPWGATSFSVPSSCCPACGRRSGGCRGATAWRSSPRGICSTSDANSASRGWPLASMPSR